MSSDTSIRHRGGAADIARGLRRRASLLLGAGFALALAGVAPGDAQPAAYGDDAAAGVSLSAIFARLALKALFWLGLAGLVGYRATQRNRGFFKWSILALVFSPALIYLILRLMGPAEEAA